MQSTASRTRVCTLDLDRTESQRTPLPVPIRRPLTSDMVAAADLLDVHAARCGGTLLRQLLHGVERLLFVGTVYGGALRHVLFAQLAFVERYLARQTVAGVAKLAVENVSVVFGEEGA